MHLMWKGYKVLVLCQNIPLEKVPSNSSKECDQCKLQVIVREDYTDFYRVTYSLNNYMN